MASRDLNGTSDEIDFGDPTNLQNPSTFTVMHWNYLDIDTRDMGLIDHFTSTGGGKGFLQFFDFNQSLPPFDETNHFIHIGGGQNNFLWQSFRVVSGEWQHSSYCWDNSNEPAATYRIRGGSTDFLVQSTEQAGQTPGPANGGNPGLNWKIGDVGFLPGSQHPDGKFSNFLAFERQLSTEESMEYAIRPNMAHTNLEVWCPLWGQDSPEPDLSGNGNTGTLTGTSTSDDGPPIFWG